ncbi:hypothetical protein [Mycolicibacterium holsaticum]|nr:hypothetical protein [Mycolicibacterium holsaticum]
MPQDLPHLVNQVAEYLAWMARGYGAKLHHREIERFKADLANSAKRWDTEEVPPAVFRQKCLDAGLSISDTETVVGLLKKAQGGHKFRPRSRFDRDHQYSFPHDWRPPSSSD